MSGAVDWAVWLLVGALGGVLTVVAVVAIRRAYRLRARTSRESSAPAVTPASAPPSHLPRRTVIGYVTVPMGPVGDAHGEAVAAIEDACARSAWTLIEIVQDVEVGSALERPGLRFALERISAGHAQGLLVKDLEQISGSTADRAALLAWFRDADATLVALDLDLETSTPDGQHVAAALIAASARDQPQIAADARGGLAQGRTDGRHHGRPAVNDRPELADRIAAMRAANMTLNAIAEQLNAEGVPTLRGGKKWRPSSIQAVLGYQRPGQRAGLPAQKPRRIT